MMTRGALALALLVGTGCVTQSVRELPSQGAMSQWEVDEDPPPLIERERQLIENTEEYPDRPGVWWALGDFYENQKQYHPALEAYEKLHETLKAVEKEKSAQLKQNVRYTAGPFHLGRINFKLKDYGLAARWLEQVLALKTGNEQQDSILDHFRESHYILGLIYYNNHHWDLADEHIRAFVRLGGEEQRVHHLQARIDQERGVRGPRLEPAPDRGK